jgi:hypothetical protein
MAEVLREALRAYLSGRPPQVPSRAGAFEVGGHALAGSTCAAREPGRAGVSIAKMSGAPVASAYRTQTQNALSGQQKL